MPFDALTVSTQVSGNGNTVIASGTNPKTILGVSMQQANVASETDLRCGTTVIARNYATNFSYTPMNKVCYNTINIDKTGNDNANVIVNYVTYDMSKKSTSTVQDIYNQATSTSQFGPNLNEWLFVVAVFLFFISWQTWGRISLTKTS